jgi:hypothetical protein
MAEIPGTISPQSLAAAVAQQLYGFRPTAITPLGSGRGRVFRVEFGGLPGKILKLGGSVGGLRREQQVLGALRRPRWGMPVPAIEMTERDLPPAWTIGGLRFQRPPALSVMRQEPGMSLADAILRGEPWAGDAMHAAGRFAARLACLPLAGLAGRRRLPGGARTVLAHGALSVSTILVAPSVSGPRLCVLDWARARAAGPTFDLDWLLGSLAELPLNDSGLMAFLRRRAIDGFRALQPEPERLDARRPGQIRLPPAKVPVP